MLSLERRAAAGQSTGRARNLFVVTTTDWRHTVVGAMIQSQKHPLARAANKIDYSSR